MNHKVGGFYNVTLRLQKLLNILRYKRYARRFFTVLRGLIFVILSLKARG